MSFCRGQFFFINNSSILGVGLKRSIQHPLGTMGPLSKLAGGATGYTGYSRSATISHFIKRLLTPDSGADTKVMKALNDFPRVKKVSRSSFVTRNSVSSPLLNQRRLFSTSVLAYVEAKSAPLTSSPPTPNPSSWPINTAKPVGYLCIACSILVFAIVVLGGLTRLTESGLSITEWKPVTGSIPPLSQEDWLAEFEKYKQSPEFKELNTDMNVEEYKFIYGMEWSHRLLGRVIGVLFVVPTLYYIARKRVSPPTALKLLGICGLLGLQGFVGWWMVYSGIDKKQLVARNSKPTVSPYRLTTHLATAFTVYCCMISTGFSILRDYKIMADPKKYQKIFQQINSPSLKRFISLSKGLFVMVFFTAMTGALVAGLDAGMIYNTFPKMGEGYIPPTDELMDPLFARKSDKSDLWWRNMLENPTTVQFNHRIMAVATFCCIFALHMRSHKMKPLLPSKAYMWLSASMGLACLQVTLGICTLLWLVPTDLGAAHQAGALGLLTGVLMVVNNLKRPSRSNLILLDKFLQKAANQRTLRSIDQYLNIKLDNIETNVEKYPHFVAVRSIFIRGSSIRYIHLNPSNVDTNLLQDASRRETMASTSDKIAGR
ncbi:hypothetical protein FOA43_002209 [Brettanomyces nanus]|uniref:Sm domain-containing protein n=1 Tax=Eeniella nana TaxID=13502 RepID=A0A875S1S7_EENNA|nr:uncharacterized protein FOA43_002209 [Brettanomyces nanus]QPG74873.1 hypothetical protein FOA43_002209 [Brettanomyces nanus]